MDIWRRCSYGVGLIPALNAHHFLRCPLSEKPVVPGVAALASISRWLSFIIVPIASSGIIFE